MALLIITAAATLFLLPAIFTKLSIWPFIPSISPLPQLSYTSYLQNPVCRPSEIIRYPKTQEDVVAIVKEAISRKTTVKAFGHRHSMTDIICTDGIPVDMRGIQGISYNAEDQTATVGAGVYVYDFTAFLKERGRALRTIPGFGNITVGGAVGTGAHGSTIKYNSSISEQVVGLTIVDGRGQLRKIDKEEDLKAFRIHLGLLGIVLDLTLATLPLYKVLAHNYAASEDILTDGRIIDIAKNTDQVSIYWFPSLKQVVIANWTIVDVITPGNAWTNDHVPPTSQTFNLLGVSGAEVGQEMLSMSGYLMELFTHNVLIRTVPDFVPIYTEDGVSVKNPAVGYYDLMFAPICKDSGYYQCFWFHGPNNNITLLDNEFSLSLDQLPRFIMIIKDILYKSPAAFPMFGILLRFSKASKTYMSSSYGRDSCHLEFYTLKRKNSYENPSMGLAAYQTILQSLTREYNGRSHWGKSGMHYHSSEMISLKLDPEALSSFVAKMKEYDPEGIFMNSFGQRLNGEGHKIDTDPATTHCALLDNCVCSKNTDCANGQICTQIDGYPNYRVCDNVNYARSRLGNLRPPAHILNSNFNLGQLLCSSELGSTTSFNSTINCNNYRI